MAEREKYYILVPHALVEVTEEIYSEYHSIDRHLETLEEKDERYGLVSYNSLDDEEIVGEEMISDPYAESVEDKATAQLMAAKLQRCVQRLSPDEQALIHAIYYEGLSERKYSKRSGIPQKTINNRKRKILTKLKKYLTE